MRSQVRLLIFLSTSLARVSGLHVVSRGRMLELMRAAPADGIAADTSAGGFVNAARRAAATQVIDGTVYARPGGRLRLDLRRVDLATGGISDVHTVEGDDLFALVDSGTARLVSALGVRGPAGSVADVTTRSATAYRMYEQGVRAYYRGDGPTALLFLRSALAEDSLFALATYQSALAAVGTEPESVMTRLDRAKRLAARAPDRERLTILAGWAQAMSSPALERLADTLAIRYPTEVEGYLYTGIARVSLGDFLAAIAPLERVVAMDSLGVRGVGPSCRACEALRWVVSAYELADSFPAAERAARRWMRLQPASIPATNALTEVLDALGRPAEADSAFHAMAYADPAADDVLPFRAMHLIRAGDYAAADRLLVAETNRPGAARQMEAYWQLAISLREQGRLAAAYNATRRIRPLTRTAERRGSSMGTSVLEAQLQLEQHRPAIAAALFDSIALRSSSDVLPSQIAFGSAWMSTHAANARAAMHDTATLVRLADSVRALGAASGYARDQRLFHHIRGLMLVARGDDFRCDQRAPIGGVLVHRWLFANVTRAGVGVAAPATSTQCHRRAAASASWTAQCGKPIRQPHRASAATRDRVGLGAGEGQRGRALRGRGARLVRWRRAVPCSCRQRSPSARGVRCEVGSAAPTASSAA